MNSDQKRVMDALSDPESTLTSKVTAGIAKSAMGGDDTRADIQLLIGSPKMFDLLNRIAGGEEG